jgi:very-short-patch-repair endonuclease
MGTDNLVVRARRLRGAATDAENVLWHRLRGRQLNGWKFRRQVIIEPYIVDFACFEAKLIIEVDGGQHAEQERYDANRTTRLNAMGYKVVRFWNHDVLGRKEDVLEEIYRCLHDTPSPQPSPGGRGSKT